MRRAMADYFAGQRFFDFYSDEPEEEEAEIELKQPVRAARHAKIVDRGSRGSMPLTELLLEP